MSQRLAAAEAERKLRAEYAALGLEPADWLVQEVRSGAWAKRQRRNLQNILRHRAQLARLKREGYTFDSERRLVAPALTRIHVPVRREREPRPRGRRTRRAGTSRASPSRLSDDEPEPPLAEPLRGLSA